MVLINISSTSVKDQLEVLVKHLLILINFYMREVAVGSNPVAVTFVNILI